MRDDNKWDLSECGFKLAKSSSIIAQQPLQRSAAKHPISTYLCFLFSRVNGPFLLPGSQWSRSVSFPCVPFHLATCSHGVVAVSTRSCRSGSEPAHRRPPEGQIMTSRRVREAAAFIWMTERCRTRIGWRGLEGRAISSGSASANPLSEWLKCRRKLHFQGPRLALFALSV